MSNLLRYTQQIFASLAGNNQLSEYGSFIASPPGNLYNGSTITPAIVQQLSNYLEGLYAATGGAYSPTIQDHNSLFYLLSYQIAYLLQKGIPEWDAGTTYFINDFVKVGEKIYISLQNTNLNHLVTDTAWWRYPDVYANSVTSNTNISAGTTITAGTGITATTGNIIASAGEISSMGDITSDNGDLNAPSGNVNANLVIASTGLTVKNGNKLSLYNVAETASTSFKSHPTATQQDYILPPALPTTSGQSLVSDTSGNMSWGNIQPLNTSSSLVTFPLSTWYSVAPGSTLQTGKYLICGHAQFNITTSTPFTATLYVGIEGGVGVPSDLDEGINALTQSFGVSTGEAIISISLTNRFIIVNSPRVLYLYANVTASSSCTAGGNLIAIPWP
jgi:hypothetical protein